MSVRQAYEAALKERGYTTDPAQQRAIDALERCATEWAAYKQKRSNSLKKLFNRPDVPLGVYMFGGVGRGKSFLMDCFFQAVPIRRKTRLHFHEFMREVHRELRDLQGTVNPLDVLGQRMAERYKLICFDEFHVADVTDAMILHRLLDALFKAGVGFVTTSNFHPDALYPDGLHRDRILPAIELLKSRLEVLSVDNGTDYRQRTLTHIQLYHGPLGPAADAAMETTFGELAEMADICADGGHCYEVGTLSKQVEEWVLVTLVKEGNHLRGFSFSTLERIGGTPCILLGVAGVRNEVRVKGYETIGWTNPNLSATQRTSGTLNFNERGVRIDNLSTNLLGGAARLDASTRADGALVFNATGAYAWVPFTDVNGAGLPGALTITDTRGITSVDGRNTTDLALFKGTDYQRPEDLQRLVDLGMRDFGIAPGALDQPGRHALAILEQRLHDRDRRRVVRVAAHEIGHERRPALALQSRHAPVDAGGHELSIPLSSRIRSSGLER